MPADVVLTPERGATIHCPATAQSQIILLVSDSSSSKNQWSPLDKNGPLLSLLSTNGTLLNLHPFRPEQFRPDVHSASYKCVAANPAGRIVSTPVRVRPITNKKFEAVVENRRVRRGSTTVFRCSFVVDSFLRAGQDVVVTSWIQDNRHDIFLFAPSQGPFLFLFCPAN